MPRSISNPLALAVLALLFERPMHPYEMASTMRERHEEESIKLNYGSLYSVVDSLVRRGFIRPGETVREGRRPERTTYEITESGHVELVDWLSELLAVPKKEFTQFEAALCLSGCLSPQDTVRLLEQRCHRLDLHARADSSIREAMEQAELPRLFTIEAEYRHALREAELAWVRRLIEEIEDGSLDGIELWRRFHDDDGRTEVAGRIRSLEENVRRSGLAQ
ncbi:MAG: PadR family transcriptional regulator [Acidimicrobiales bacterium]